MPISRFLWPDDRVEHIAQHGVTPDEFEEVCFGRSLTLRAKAYGANPVYYILGETDARDMTTKEKRRYADWKTR